VSGWETVLVAEPITFVSADLVLFREYFCWVSLKHFAIDGSASDTELLAALREHDQFHDHYAGQPVEEQDHHSLHGPYELSRVTVEAFQVVEPAIATEEVKFWVATWSDNDDLSGIEDRIDREVAGFLLAPSLYALRGMTSADQHEWGWVVGSQGFHEYVAIDKGAGTLTLLVAADD
jgi:hypothetical protein